MKFGFIGVGNMGNPMALNLIKGGHSLRIHDIKREAAENLIEDGATWVDSSQAAAEGAEGRAIGIVGGNVEHCGEEMWGLRNPP